MKKLLFVSLFVLAFSTVSFATPFMVCDPQTGVTTYKLTGPAWLTTPTVPAQVDGSVKLDVVSSSAGSNSLTVAACVVDAIWGEVCSSAVPFVFTRPSTATPTTLKLIK